MNTPFVLLPYQQAWLADTTPVRIAEKSRRIGLSWGAASECVIEAATGDGGCDTWYVGYNHDMAQEFIRDCAGWARKFNLVTSEVEEFMLDDEDGKNQILTFAINFSSGYRITALSSRPTNLRGKKGHIILDEAAFHDDLKGLIKSAMAVLMWGGKARVDIISTHNGTENYFAKLVEETRSKKRPYSLHRTTIDEALEQGLYKRICLVNGAEWSPELEAKWRQELFALYGDDAEEELLCVPARSGGTYIGRDLVELAMVPGSVHRLTCVPEFTNWPEAARIAHVDAWMKENLAASLAALPKDKIHFFGEDFGRTSDRTVIAPGYVAQDLRRIFPFAVELSGVPYEQQRQVLFYIVEKLPRFVKGALDATGNGGYLAEVCAQKFGEARIEKVMLTDKWYAENLPPFKAAFEDKLTTMPRDADHMLDIGALKVINGLPKLPKAKTSSTGEGPPRHGDAAIAYALGHYASRLPSIAYGYTPAKKPTSGFNARRGVF